MRSKVIMGYIIISVVLATFDAIFAWACFRRKDRRANYLGYTALAGGAVDLTYLASILTQDYLVASIMSSAYFACIDWMLLACLTFVCVYTNQKETSRVLAVRKGLVCCAILDTILFALNPIVELSVSYVDTGIDFARFTYDMKFPYLMHLVFTYGMVLYVLFALVRKFDRTPRQYRQPYTMMILGIIAIVGVNAVFLYTPITDVLPHVDFSIIGYSLIMILMYVSCFEYTKNQMLKELSVTVFENIGQGIVLFDFEGYLVMKNDRAVQLLHTVWFRNRMTISDFLRECNISEDLAKEEKGYSLQCYLKGAEKERAARCDYRPLRDGRGQRWAASSSLRM